MRYQCLIVDDEVPLADSTAEYFNMFGVTAFAVYDFEQCLNFLNGNEADVILLDINLKDASGFELCRRIRETTQSPILFISARESDDDILLALNIGGDDYIRKPYKLSILLAKVKAVLRRLGAENTNVYHMGNLTVDCEAGRAFMGSVPIRLKTMEYKLLCYLVQNRGRVVSKEELFQEVWEDSITGDGTLNVHIRHLREKIEQDPNHPEFIRTVWGTGYYFEG